MRQMRSQGNDGMIATTDDSRTDPVKQASTVLVGGAWRRARPMTDPGCARQRQGNWGRDPVGSRRLRAESGLCRINLWGSLLAKIQRVLTTIQPLQQQQQ